jgi:hypothetical protein
VNFYLNALKLNKAIWVETLPIKKKKIRQCQQRFRKIDKKKKKEREMKE